MLNYFKQYLFFYIMFVREGGKVKLKEYLKKKKKCLKIIVQYACLKIVKFLPDSKPLKYALHTIFGSIGRPPKPPHMVR